MRPSVGNHAATWSTGRKIIAKIKQFEAAALGASPTFCSVTTLAPVAVCGAASLSLSGHVTFRSTLGSTSGRSSAIIPDRMRWRIRRAARQRRKRHQMPAFLEPIAQSRNPASTSPEPAVASHGGALALMAARPSGDCNHRIRAFEDYDRARVFAPRHALGRALSPPDRRTAV